MISHNYILTVDEKWKQHISGKQTNAGDTIIWTKYMMYTITLFPFLTSHFYHGPLGFQSLSTFDLSKFTNISLHVLAYTLAGLMLMLVLKSDLYQHEIHNTNHIQPHPD